MYKLDYEDKKKLRDILTKLYGSHNAERWEMNMAVYKVLVEMMVESGQCSNAMDWVPRPYGGGNPVSYLKAQVVKAFLRFFSRDHNEHCLICLKVAANHYRSAIVFASRFGY